MLHLDRIKEDCREALTTNTSLWARDALHNFPVPPQDVVDFLCLNDCSGHGQCSSGESQVWEPRDGNMGRSGGRYSVSDRNYQIFLVCRDSVSIITIIKY